MANILDRDDRDYNKMDGERRRRGFSGNSLCPSPRWVLSRFLSYLKRKSRESINSRTRVVLSERRREDDSKSVDGSLFRCLIDDAEGESSSSLVEESPRTEIGDSSGRFTKELSFNLGLGVGLAFLIAASKSEFKKMMELQTQMEMLLKEIKDGMQRKDVCSVESESNNNFSCSMRDFNEVSYTDYNLAIQNHQSSNQSLEAEITMDCNQFPKCDIQRREGCSVGIDQLEAELEAELERLQFRLRSEDSPKNMQPQWEEMAVANDDLNGNCFEKVDDFQDSDSSKHHGVCPLELERRLHELQEARQQEKIAELRFALDCAKHNLLEKEMEISRWKEAARLINQQVPPEVSCLSR
ncbi:protein POLAR LOCALIZATION DURING ASYMMETRIC DIVISION AND REDISTRIBUTION-like [Macadamia integrifolia]|uniref:protein POLAR LOCALIZATION DURING ASYMMETRIC DIVISION AND REDISTRIBUTION-like n=1 Tax=Macadamia integrifolia TaxID=60698 RepID=UPI001C4F6133|nr:protein POLAR LOCALIZATION DURING ASYMMETRIC DIVISION AND REDISTRIBUTION-like [Macadamia integrifolia]